MIKRHSGFSLLEVLIAFAILALSLTIILRVFASGVHTAVQANEYSMASQIAESLLASAGVERPLQLGMSSGRQGERFRWMVWVEPYQSQQPVNTDTANTLDARLWALWSVRVEVLWDDNDEAERSVELHTLKLVAIEDKLR